MPHHIVTLPGDGIGPEIMAPTLRLLEAVGEFEFEEHAFGGAAIDLHGVALTDQTLAACRAADAVLLAAVGGPKWDSTDPGRAAPRAGPVGAAQGARAVRQPAPGQAAAGAVRRLAAAPRARAGHGPAGRQGADRRDLLRREDPQRRRRLGSSAPTRARRSNGSRAPRSGPRAAASAASTRPMSWRPRACGARSSASCTRASSRTSSSSTCSSTTPPCSSSPRRATST